MCSIMRNDRSLRQFLDKFYVQNVVTVVPGSGKLDNFLVHQYWESCNHRPQRNSAIIYPLPKTREKYFRTTRIFPLKKKCDGYMRTTVR